MPIGRLLELAVGTALAPRIEERVGTDSLSVFDWPITAGARIVRRRPGVTFGGGLFAALHLRWASAAGTDAGMAQSSTSFTAGAGAGAEALARIRLTGALAGELRLYAEVPLPPRTTPCAAPRRWSSVPASASAWASRFRPRDRRCRGAALTLAPRQDRLRERLRFQPNRPLAVPSGCGGPARRHAPGCNQ